MTTGEHRPHAAEKPPQAIMMDMLSSYWKAQALHVVAKLGIPVDFDSLDDQPVDLIVVLLAPVGAGADHLKALARVARLLRTESLVEQLRQSNDPERTWNVPK